MTTTNLSLLHLATENRNVGLVLCLVFCSVFGKAIATSAQIVPDDTLPDNSVVVTNADRNFIEINGGTTAGNNLFHSFEQFSIADSQTAFFNNGLGIENILSRVTGGNISNIAGTIGSAGTANLFLINPNGIIFGENAALNVGGSFIGSTAESIQFGDRSEFSAVNPQESSLLSVNIPLGLQYGSGSGDITVKGIGNNTGFADPGANDYSLIKDFRPSGLQVIESNTLALIGGNVALEGGNLTTAAGHIELGGVEEGLVKLDLQNNIWSFDYQDTTGLQNIGLVDAASVEVSGNSSGTVNVVGENITATDASAILANTSGDGTAGSISLNGTESVQITGASQNEIPFVSYVATDTTADSTGAGADLNINTNYLLVAGGGQVASAVFGSGAGGTINVDAERIELDSGSAIANSSGIFAPIVPGATGAGGDINLETDSLLVTGGAQAYTLAISSSQGGDFNINAREIELRGLPSGFPSGLFTNTLADGDGGNLNIDTDSLILVDGANIGSTVGGSGTAGNIDIKANNIELTSPSEPVSSSSISASVEEGAVGVGGNITIETNSLNLSEGTQINSSVFGSGTGGNVTVAANDINLTEFSKIENIPSGIFASVFPGAVGSSGNVAIDTERLQILAGAQISVSTFGSGSAGNLTVTASDSVILKGNAIEAGGGSSGLFSSAAFGDGDGGNVDLNAKQLTIQDGAIISVSNFFSGNADVPPGTGKAGNIQIDADKIELDGIDNNTPASINAATFAGGGGNIVLNSKTITATNQSQVTAETSGSGAGGSIEVNTDNLVLNSNAAFSSSTIAAGDGGKIAINGKSIEVSNRAEIATDSTGKGEAGDIAIASDALNLDRGLITASSLEAGGGEITLSTNSLNLDNNSLISTSVFTSTGGAGNIAIDNSGFIIGKNNSSIQANADRGNGGNIQINSEGFFFDKSSKVTASSNSGIDGVVEINDLESNKRLNSVQLPATISTPEAVVASSCPVPEQNTFSVTGLGGMPENPSSYLTGRTLWQDVRQLNNNIVAHKIPANTSSNTQSESTTQSNSVVESQGWIVNSQGQVELVAATTPQIGQQRIQCGDL